MLSEPREPSVSAEPPLVEVRNLRVSFATPAGRVAAVQNVSFAIARGETLALVGESGSGKSVTALSLLRLVQAPGCSITGRILLRSRRWGDVDLGHLDEDSGLLYNVRGGVMSMIFQEPLSALSPVHTIGAQIDEAIRLHQDVSAAAARRRTLEMLAKVGMTHAADRYRQYPHELSGGLRQRAVIAMALVCRPEVLIADEPTTALDMTVQAQILGLIRSLQREIGCAVLLITHDFGVVAQMADRVAVMHGGEIIEHGDVRSILRHPRQAHTRALLAAVPGRSRRRHGGTLGSGSTPAVAAP